MSRMLALACALVAFALAAGPATAQHPLARRADTAALRSPDHARRRQARDGRRRARSGEEFVAGRHHHPRQRRQSGDVPQGRQRAARLHRRVGGQSATALTFKRPSKALDDAIAAGGAGLRLLAVKDITPLEGGIPILVDGKIVGAIGVSGALSSQDAQVAKAGADALAK